MIRSRAPLANIKKQLNKLTSCRKRQDLQHLLPRLVFAILLMSPLIACHENNKPSSFLPQHVLRSRVPIYSFYVIHKYPHDAHHFTEGLVLDNDYLYESAGLYNQSKLQKKNINTGKLAAEYLLAPHYFAEGIAMMGNDIYQLTYQEHTGFVYDKNTLTVKKTFHYAGEGWGLTTDGKQLIMSNGSDTLSFIDPQTFTITHTIVVHDQAQHIAFLNELEYINGKIYANIWPTAIIAIISPITGKVEGWINIESLDKSADCVAAFCVANGIAYNKKNNTLLITGKNWLYMYEIKLNAASLRELPR